VVRAARRDVKPENLLCQQVDGKDVIKLADFGSSMQLPPEGTLRVDPVAQGTTLYSPPEVLEGTCFSCSADIWATGITTYVLISGYFPFGCTADALSSTATFESDAWFAVSIQACSFISELLQHSASARPSAIGALQHRWLRPAMCETPPAANPVTTPPACTPIKRDFPASLQSPDSRQWPAKKRMRVVSASTASCSTAASPPVSPPAPRGTDAGTRLETTATAAFLLGQRNAKSRERSALTEQRVSTLPPLILSAVWSH
jgi:serine/threonine protein kinase